MPQKRERRGEELREIRCRQCIGQHGGWEEENKASTSNGEAGGHETSEGGSTRTGELGAKGISPIGPSKPELSPKLSCTPPEADFAISRKRLHRIRRKRIQRGQLGGKNAGTNFREKRLRNEGDMAPGTYASVPECRKVNISGTAERVTVIQTLPDSCERVVPPCKKSKGPA
ncbi:hypothetical protein EDC04DRAFT_1907703 [Pisolithus marmoratus]|nr:hypothetical protein EDC04DRAFT_1907703 [Pisolithus marmoratus]